MFALLAAAIGHTVMYINIYIIMAIPPAGMFVGAFISIIVKSNFIFQSQIGEVEPQIISDPNYKKFCRGISIYWTIILFIMAFSSGLFLCLSLWHTHNLQLKQPIKHYS